MTQRRRTDPGTAAPAPARTPDHDGGTEDVFVRVALWVASVGVLFPIVFAAVRHSVSTWVPIGDSAYFTARSLDVGTVHTPLIGAWSSGSLEYARPVNSLGPMELFLLAPFTHIAPAAGTAVGVAAVQVAAVATIIALLKRMYGAGGAVAGLVGVAWLVWAMGSENLVAAVQHPYLILPFAATLVAAIGALGGQRWALLVAVAFGSLCAQTHLSYPILIAVLLMLTTIGHVQWWQCADPARRAKINQATAIAALTGFVLWLPPLIDQFFGTGNLVAAITQGGGDQYPTGFRLGTRIVATVATQPTTLGPDGFVSIDLNTNIVGGTQAAILLFALAAGLGLAVWAFRTSRSTLGYWSLVLSATGIALVINAALIPGSVFGYRIDNYRWIWAWMGVIGAGLWLAFNHALAQPDLLGPTGSRWWRRYGPLGLAVIVCGFGVANLATRGVPDMATYQARTEDVSMLATQLDDYLEQNPVDGPMVIDDTHLYLGAPYNYPIAAVLQRHGVDFRFPSQIYGYRFGQDRVETGDEPFRLTILVRDDARAALRHAVAWSEVGEPVALVLEADRVETAEDR